MLVRANVPGGNQVARRLVGSELDSYTVPESMANPGYYIWQVQAACSDLSPFDVSNISSYETFTVHGADCPVSVSDIDGNTYGTIPVGSQCWMAENLATETYRDGSAITTGWDNYGWQYTTSGAFAVHGDNPANKGT
jgi:hypothetical protein